MSTPNPYRQSARNMQQPTLTFTEKLYVSNSKLKKFLLHVILMFQSVWKPISAVVLLCTMIIVGLGLLALAGYGFEWLCKYAVSHHYLTKMQCAIIGAIMLLVVILVPPTVTVIRDVITDNNRDMKEQIEKKMKAAETTHDHSD